MSRLTITLSEARYRALKEAAAQRGKTIGRMLDDAALQPRVISALALVPRLQH